MTTLNLVKSIKTRIIPKFSNFFNASFSEKYLLYTNVGLSLSLSGVGDVLMQHYELLTSDELKSWNKTRTRNMSVCGMTIGIFCHYWYNYLDRKLPGYTIQIVLKKIIVDQIVCSPVCIATLFLTSAVLERRTKEELILELKQKSLKLYAAEWVVWPCAQFINFYFLPTKFRVLYDNTISLGYDVYTSYVKHSKPSEEVKFIPGLNKAFHKSFSDRYLIYTNIGLSLALSAAGDVLCQEGDIIAGESTGWNKIRTRNMGVYGMLMGVLNHFWYHHLDRCFPGYTFNIVWRKIILDQIFVSPFCIESLFITVGILEHKTGELIMEDMRNKMLLLYFTDWMVWPPAQVLNFYFLPTKYRVLYGNAISLGYDTYLSYMKYDRKKEKEKGKK